MLIIMFSSKFSLFCLVGILCIFLCVGYSNIPSCIEIDKQALLKLKDGFIDDSNILSSWKNEVDCCRWNGISCNNLTGRVTKLYVHLNATTTIMDSTRLRGNIDSSLCDLQHLTHLNLSFNDFEGTKIPKCIGSLGQLRELILSDSTLGGAIPHELKNLSNLQTLDLGYNFGLIANDLKWISNLSSLRYLDLSNVDLSRAIDWQLSLSSKVASQLKKLILMDSALVGVISHELQNLSNLQTLSLGRNYDLIANNLGWISHLSSLRYLDLSMVNLSRATDWQSLLSSKVPFLVELHLYDCALPKVNPKSLFHINSSASLKVLSLGSNYLDSSMLSWLSNVSRVLEHLDLSQNSLQHIFPNALNANSLKFLSLSKNLLQQIALDAFTNATSLEHLDLSVNNLEGNIIRSISNLCRLKELILYGNNFSGQLSNWIPQLYFAQYSIETLDLSKNPFSGGPFPDFSRFASLVTLQLQNINFYGSIPQSFGNFPCLLKLDVSYNNLSGPLPKFVGFPSLEILDLSNNQLNGIVPQSFGYLPHLLEFYLNSNNLSGPLSKFVGFPSLEILDLSNNQLNRIVPQSFGYLPHLLKFYLNFNNLTGPLPKFFGFPSLKILDLSNNQLNGMVPQSFGYLPHLLEFYLNSNNLSGPLPKFVGFPSLKILYLSNNQLNGIVPQTFEQVPNLVSLEISSNKLNCVISEAHLLTLSSLKLLDVSHNLIFFNISTNWVPPFQLQAFFASSCNLGPNFPVWLRHQKELIELDISNGAILDSIPQWFWLISNMAYLNISHNKIYGKLPKSLPKIKVDVLSNYIWDLSFNNLFGPLPHFSPYVSTLLLSNNKFSGSITFICATLQSRLTYLDMSSNLLSGKLPDCWGSFRSLRVLNLADNNFSGIIPNSIGTLKDIMTIHFNNNNLSGEMPFFINSPYLQFIDFGQNNLHGKLPTWIGHYLPNLIVLRLQANKFHGSIPASICNLLLLQVLDLSHNNITGIIPHCLNNLSALSNVTFRRHTISYDMGGVIDSRVGIWPLFIDNAMLTWKGEYVEYGKNLGLMTTIDLSCNHLKGEIPSNITTLTALASLNLSRNNLTGFIPKNMGQMTMLESLDFSSNYLSGGIPMSFSALSFLSFLNLSFNKLSGKIPQTTQLQTFDASSYIGNYGLCGLPLPKGCPGEESLDLDPKTSHNIDVDEDDKLTSFVFYASMIFGFIIGFWGVCGTLILKSSWRQAYFHFFNNMYDKIYVQIVIFKTRMKRRFQD